MVKVALGMLQQPRMNPQLKRAPPRGAHKNEIAQKYQTFEKFVMALYTSVSRFLARGAFQR